MKQANRPWGGPAAQIVLMHRVLVEEMRWLSERGYLNALNFCMLLPGPEAMLWARAGLGWVLAAASAGWLLAWLF